MRGGSEEHTSPCQGHERVGAEGRSERLVLGPNVCGPVNCTGQEIFEQGLLPSVCRHVLLSTAQGDRYH
jgi:hypothetical protein